MNDTLLITLAAAAISGLTVIAYKHPEGYRRIFICSLPLLVMFVLVITAFHLGSMHYSNRTAYDNLQRYPTDMLKDHAFPIRSMHDDLQALLTLYAYFVPACAYLVFLRFLPQILGITIPRRGA